MRLACVPLPAPGGPRRMTGSMVRTFASAIELATSADFCLPKRPPPGCLRQLQRGTRRELPAPAPDPSATGSKPIVMAHNELRFNLRNGIHGYAHYDEQ